ncbi:LysR family transcriptional regulator [Phenylobacterium sp.]|jgi:DNA-binding transcriptional LysR family regulator|uniref:LysR family transcriptional regulator n=1 Tax=Phenylobacterium sp. TaxID=1871053 RepID=UPI002E35D68A|nr:LysR family transcriptional regulator [Phenylobacterium sp.]HEX4710946.1 LysR family transcriptional regulator [Phenylobacterium sp.]
MNLDLNLLRVFDVMLEERSVTRAGARLGLTQSAVSHALSRLRYTLSDDLFVRGPAGMQPTPRAVEMGPQVHAALNQLQAALAPSDFDPATSERRFALVTGAYAGAILAPPVVSRLAQVAPRSELMIAELALDILERLDARRVDFLVGSVLAAPERFARETILTEKLVWVVRAGHPAFQGENIDLETLVSTPHVVMARNLPGLIEEGGERRPFVSRASWEDSGAFEAALAARGLTRRVGASVPDTFTALAIASRTDMATLIPQRLALLSAQSGRVTLIEPPYESPSVEVSLLYLKDRLAEPAIIWMRDLIRAVAATL